MTHAKIFLDAGEQLLDAVQNMRVGRIPTKDIERQLERLGHDFMARAVALDTIRDREEAGRLEEGRAYSSADFKVSRSETSPAVLTR